MKKIHRFLISDPISTQIITIEDAETVHLIKNVLKLRIDEECIVFTDGSDDYLSRLSNIQKHALTLSVESIIPKKIISKFLTGCISITKKDTFELVVQKLTEIGVQNIIPIISDRTIKQSLRIDRLQKISDEALEQSGLSTRVNILEPQALEEVLELNKNKEQYCFDIEGGEDSQSQNTNIAFYIGPEGGWSEEDKKLFKKYSVHTYKLGETTLRAETAAIVAAYKLLWV